MILRISRKEFVELARDGRYRASAAIVSILMVGALAVGWEGWRDVSRQHQRAESESRRRFEGQGEKNPHSAAHYGLHLFKPKSPLAFIDPGVDPYTGISVFLEAHRRNEVDFRPARDATALERFGDLTATAVLQVLLPLVIIFLAFPAFAGEREQGTLRQVLSLGVRPRDLVLGKALGLAAALGTIVLPAVIAGSILLSRAGGEGPGTWQRAAALAVGYLLYLGVFLAVALVGSMRAASSRSALVALLGFWILNAMVAPRLATDLSRRLHPTPSALQFSSAIEREIKGGVDGHDPQDDRLRQLEEHLLEQYDVDSVEDLPLNFQGVALQAGEDFGNAVFDRHYGSLWSAFDRQDATRSLLGFLAPTLAIRSLSMGLAGTDAVHHRAFAEAAEQHRRRLVRLLNEDLATNGVDLGFMYQAGPELWEQLPRFRFEPPTPGETAARLSLEWLSLALWTLGAVAAAAWSARSLRID
jgi:ABC-2 type transport system permease protein